VLSGPTVGVQAPVGPLRLIQAHHVLPVVDGQPEPVAGGSTPVQPLAVSDLDAILGNVTVRQ
jgi:hypothetical protein